MCCNEMGCTTSTLGTDCLTSRKITKSILIEWCKKTVPAPKYIFQEITDRFTNGEFSINILFFPLAHPELNTIELAVSFMKQKIRARNLNLNLHNIQTRAANILGNISVQQFASFSEHAFKEEEIYRETAEVVDLTLDNTRGAQNDRNNTVVNEILDDDSVTDDRTVTS